MIALLNGKVLEKTAASVIVLVGGVGYEVLVTAEDHGSLTTGSDHTLYIYEHIRENSYDLFGFTSKDIQQVFELLLGVNGVGPKMALNVLSVGSANSVRQAIASGDTKYIQQASGVGKRVAERIVVELKDKVGLAGVDLATTGLLQSEINLSQDEAAAALISLGYSPQDASLALHDVDPALSVEERIKLALRQR